MKRDDMVFSPTTGRKGFETAATRARMERRWHHHKTRGPLSRVNQVRAMSRRVRHTLLKSQARKSALARMGARGAARGAAAVGRGAAGAARLAGAGGIITAVLVGLIVGGTVAIRLGTGQPLEGLGERVNHMLLGDLDDAARAKMSTRRTMQANPHLTQVAGATSKNGVLNSQIRTLGAQIYRQRKAQEDGAARFRREFPANSTIDMIILRAADLFRSFWRSGGGPDAVDRLETKYKKLKASTKGRRSTR
jgi:hypothetical protein